MIRVEADGVEHEPHMLSGVHQELDAVQPEGLRHATCQLPDGVTFLDLAEGDDLPQPLPQLVAFQRYRSAFDDRCQQAPTMTELREVGSYGYR